ncbi:MAG: hypothetical protein HDT29_05720 [Clostridiales bacterium]|nr:hypothetical protein [Clostridiales bacterium]
MANLVCNHLIIHGKNAIEIMRSVLKESEETDCGFEFDFEKIVPMPEELNLPASELTKNCARLYINGMVEYCEGYKKYGILFKQAYNGDYFTLMEDEQSQLMKEALSWKNYETQKPYFNNKAEVYACGKQALDNYAKYGSVDWYDWCIKNWGTKWNAYDTQINDIDKADIYFDTANTPAIPIIKVLSEKYPDCKFEYEYAEEQVGYNAGYYDYENGIAVRFAEYPDESKEAYEMYFALWGQEDEFKFNPKTNTYEPIDGEVM